MPYSEEVRRLVKQLKRRREGPQAVEALRHRLAIHMEDPTLDPLSHQVWPAYRQLPSMLEEPFSLLDAGCMSGFLYFHLKRYFKDFTYTGVDCWPEALTVARENFPHARFIEADFFEAWLEPHDYVVVSNIPFGHSKNEERAVKHLRQFAKRALVVIYPDSEIKVIESSPRAAPGISNS